MTPAHRYEIDQVRSVLAAIDRGLAQMQRNASDHALFQWFGDEAPVFEAALAYVRTHPGEF